MSAQPTSATPSRPADVDTGFWLWLAALPLLIIGQIVDIYFTATSTGATMAEFDPTNAPGPISVRCLKKPS